MFSAKLYDTFASKIVQIFGTETCHGSQNALTLKIFFLVNHVHEIVTRMSTKLTFNTILSFDYTIITHCFTIWIKVLWCSGMLSTFTFTFNGRNACCFWKRETLWVFRSHVWLCHERISSRALGSTHHWTCDRSSCIDCDVVELISIFIESAAGVEIDPTCSLLDVWRCWCHHLSECRTVVEQNACHHHRHHHQQPTQSAVRSVRIGHRWCRVLLPATSVRSNSSCTRQMALSSSAVLTWQWVERRELNDRVTSGGNCTTRCWAHRRICCWLHHRCSNRCDLCSYLPSTSSLPTASDKTTLCSSMRMFTYLWTKSIQLSELKLLYLSIVLER